VVICLTYAQAIACVAVYLAATVVMQLIARSLIRLYGKEHQS
jgi:hypothetical protein